MKHWLPEKKGPWGDNLNLGGEEIHNRKEQGKKKKKGEDVANGQGEE